MSLLIKNGLIVNSDKTSTKPQDILIEQGKIEKIGSSLDKKADQVVDAKGKHVLPGFIDMHVHLRQPGYEYKETIESGSMAAAKGGFTTIMCMPNTDPVIDNAAIVEGILKEARRVGLVNVIPIGAISKGQKGEELSDLMELKEAGCLAISDDGKSVLNSQLMRHAMEYAKMTGLLVIDHCEDHALAHGGVMNESYNSTLLGLKGIPGIAETIIIARDIELARYLKTKIHLAHVSLKRSVELIRAAKGEGIEITAEATPHHFSLSDEAVKTFDTNTKVNPPLRTKEDVGAIKKALKDNLIDAIATDHAPHALEEKELEYDNAPFGIIGLETAFGLTMTELVHPEIISLPQLVDKLSTAPARIAGLKDKGTIKEGFDGDLVIVDLEKEWIVEKEKFVSRSHNSPFIGRQLKGMVLKTIYHGKLVYSAE